MKTRMDQENKQVASMQSDGAERHAVGLSKKTKKIRVREQEENDVDIKLHSNATSRTIIHYEPSQQKND